MARSIGFEAPERESGEFDPRPAGRRRVPPEISSYVRRGRAVTVHPLPGDVDPQLDVPVERACTARDKERDQR
jgi:hypothetical protein